MLRRYPRFRRASIRAVHFFVVSTILFLITYLTWILNKLFDTLSLTYPDLFPGVATVIPNRLNVIAIIAIYVIGVAFLFWILSRANPEVWKNIERMLGWEKETKK